MLRNRATEARGRRKKPNFEEKIRFLFNSVSLYVLHFLFIRVPGYMFANLWFSDTIFHKLNHSNSLPPVHRAILDWGLTNFGLAALEGIRYNVAIFGIN